MSDELLLRPVTAEEFEDYERAAVTAFGEALPDDDLPRRLAVFEPDRSLAVFDGSQVVATSGAFSTALRVPGGEVALGVLTAVSVHRGYRRRGLLARMIRRLLKDARERGEHLSALFASEATIYGRFGYGIASQEVNVRVDRRASAFRRDAPSGGRIRTVDLPTARDVIPPVYRRVRDRYLGMPARTPGWWDYQVLADPESERRGFGPKDYALHLNGDGEIDGYAVSRLKPAWDARGPDGTVEVIELMAATPQAAAGLWRYCLDTDLSEHLRAGHRPADDPLFHLLADPRKAERTTIDGLWLRLVDMPAALEQRAWNGTDRLVLSVADAFCPDNQGHWSLEVADGKGRCTRTQDAADLHLDAESLGGLYLGQVRPSALAAAGRLRDVRPEAAARFDALLGITPLPWAPEVF